MLILWLKFVICAVAVVFCGYRICIYAEGIARITKLGRTFIGLMLLAVVTSLPELAVTIGATQIGALDLALGDLFGSNLFNLTIIAVIFLAFIRKPQAFTFDSTHLLSSGLSILLIALAAVGIVFYNLGGPRAGYSNIRLDAETALILLTYIFGVYLIFRSEKPAMPIPAEAQPLSNRSSSAVWFKFLIYAAILVTAAIYLSRLGDQIARIPVGGLRLGGTFVGGLFIAVITSLPEAAVAISAVKLGFLDMGLGNIFGSNMFNMAIIPVVDLYLGRKSLLSSVEMLHLLTALFVIISTALVTSGLVYRSRRKTSALAWDTLSILFVYFTANIVIFYLR